MPVGPFVRQSEVSIRLIMHGLHSMHPMHLHQAVGVEQQVGRLHVAVQQLSRVHVLESFETLPDDIPAKE